MTNNKNNNNNSNNNNNNNKENNKIMMRMIMMKSFCVIADPQEALLFISRWDGHKKFLLS